MAAIDEATRLGQHRTDAGVLKVEYRPIPSSLKLYRGKIRAAFAERIDAGRPLSWLDIGAGYGELVAVAMDILPPGSSVLGVEPMEAKARAAQAHGLPVRACTLDSLEGSFDVISLMNVFSHLPDFRSFLGDLARLLKPDGSLFLRTGNGGDLSRRADYPDKLDLPDHLVFAGRSSLRRILEEQGLTVTWEDTERLDTVRGAAKLMVKKALGKPVPFLLPYTSPFRDCFVRADRTMV
ncbi:hypothetical protein B2G71_15985 [Novosphingobium sp. PC22D]|nr:hypothetical protein B2G71_15985 [Novosphingobium sp. PC22D]